MVYSTKLRNDTGRYVAKCIVNRNGPRVVDFVVDTGAKYTCCSALSIDSRIEESGIGDAETKILGGIIAGSVLKVYKYHVDQFTIGTVDMGEQDIWITFDDRATDDVLGMDILQKVFFLQDADKRKILFSKDKCELV